MPLVVAEERQRLALALVYRPDRFRVVQPHEPFAHFLLLVNTDRLSRQALDDVLELGECPQVFSLLVLVGPTIIARILGDHFPLGLLVHEVGFEQFYCYCCQDELGQLVGGFLLVRFVDVPVRKVLRNDLLGAAIFAYVTQEVVL